MNEYIEQLKRLKALKPHLVFPSHGPVVAIPERLIDHYITHRSARHQRVLESVKKGLSDLELIAADAYADTPNAHPVLAADQTLSHLLAHERRGLVRRTGRQWSVIEK